MMSQLEIVKNYVLANVTSLHGPVQAFDIDKFERLNSTDTIAVQGTYTIPFERSYNFTMTINTNGIMLSYERKPKTEFDRVAIS